MAALLFLLLVVTAVGQLAISVATVNRWHSLGFSRFFLKAVDKVFYLITVGLPLATAMAMYRSPASLPWWVIVYCSVCIAAVITFIATRVYHNTSIKTTPRLVSNHTYVTNVAKKLGSKPTAGKLMTVCGHLPLNEIFQLSIHEKQIRLPRLPEELDGFRITHLSDLHMTGQLTKPFYDEVVRLVNEQPSDLIAITGDIVEKVSCLDWIADTLGRLESKHGIYFVLGNHERKIRDEKLLRSTLTDAGMLDLGSQSQLITHNGYPIFLGGNELPWYRSPTDFTNCPAEHAGHRPFRMLLTHSPDQWKWARDNDCDLMLAGHTHGGQVRFPIIGPVLAPSRMGTRYAAGTFYEEPTLMHVSRGVAGTRPLRLNCRPEIARLVLRSEAK